MRAWLRDEGDEYPIDLADLDAQVRKGALSGDAELRYPPWTGASFRRLRDLEPLEDALDAPDARFADYLRQRRTPWLTGAVAAMVMGVAMVQSALSSSELPWALARLQRTFHQWAVGLEPTLLDGRWWTLWASQLSHADLLHALFNVPIIAYCGYRVEQALAPGGALAVMAAALLVGGLAIVGLDSVPVFGSSIVAYGLWSAQIAVGLRMGEAIPRALRGRYGMGNLVFFAPLYAASLFNPEVSHLGHGGGIIGGALVAFFLSAESMAGRHEQHHTRARVMGLVGLLSVAPLILLAGAARMPEVAYAPYTDHLDASTGARVRMPARMLEHPVRSGGLQGWRPSENGNEPLFIDQMRLSEPMGEGWTEGWWSRTLGRSVETLAPPEPLGEGWTSHRLRAGRFTIVEHQLRRGRWLMRVGHMTRRPASRLAGRRALYDQILSTVEVLEIPDLAEARARWETAGHLPGIVKEYARELRYAGQPAAAEALLAQVEAPTAWVVRERLAIWQEYPSVVPDDAAGWLSAWMDGYTFEIPADEAVLAREVADWLASTGRLAEADALLASRQQPGEWIARARLDLWRAWPQATPPDAEDWIRPLIEGADLDTQVFLNEAVAWMVETDRCHLARAYLGTVQRRTPWDIPRVRSILSACLADQSPAP